MICYKRKNKGNFIFLYDNVNDDVNDFVIDTWLLSLRNRKLACISLVCTSVDLGFATFTHPNRRPTLQSMEVIVNVIVIVEKHTSRSQGYR